MARNKITDLRDHLFETLEALKDRDNPMEIDRALAISKVADTIINTAKVEVAFAKAIDASVGSPFFSTEQPRLGAGTEKKPNGHLV